MTRRSLFAVHEEVVAVKRRRIRWEWSSSPQAQRAALERKRDALRRTIGNLDRHIVRLDDHAAFFRAFADPRWPAPDPKERRG